MPGLYENINKRRKAGTSRPKSQSTIDPKTYAKMGTPAFDGPKKKSAPKKSTTPMRSKK